MDLSTLMPQQLQIVKTLDRPLFVSAGAGSGKTFTLTRRIVYALSPESGPFVEHIEQVIDEAMNEYAKPIEIEVTFTAEPEAGTESDDE